MASKKPTDSKLSYLCKRIQVVVRIAFGNLWEHKSKTLILGTLVTIGVMLIVCGNAFLEASRRSVENDLRQNFTGDVFIHGLSEEGNVSLFGVTQFVSTGELYEVPVIPDTEQLIEIVKATEGVENFTTSIYTPCLLYNDQMPEDWEAPTDFNIYPMFYMFSGDPETYWDVLPAVSITEGRYPAKNQPEILISNLLKDKYEKYYGKEIHVGEKILVRQMAGITLREVTICGFFEPANSASIILSVCYADTGTARSMADLTYGSALAKELPEEVDTSLSDWSEDDMFGDDASMFDDSESMMIEFTEDDLDSILGDTSLRDKLNETDDGAWHYMQVRLKDKSDQNRVISELNQKFSGMGLALKADDPKTAGGEYGQVNDMIDALFSILVAILAIVVFIIIMNTLIVSVIERTSEIGTMRAIGGSRGFIRGLFFSESVMITTIASILGIILALFVIEFLNGLNIVIEGETARATVGSGVLQMIPTIPSMLKTAGIVILGSVLANLYPVAVALKITPLKAMNQGQ